ncbi:MAG: glutamine synthetase [Rhodoglobus sp.]|nr:glutamine synthetase [Rhodoglobus sp.]
MTTDLADLHANLSELHARLVANKIDVLRLIFPDILGITRSKDLLVSQLERVKSPAFCQGVWVTTTRGGVLDGNDIMSNGLPDLITRIDASTLKMLPWEPGVAIVIADAFNPDQTPSEVAPRSILRHVIDQYAAIGLTPIVGPELEFYIAEHDENGWRRAINRTGRVYTTGAWVDPDGTFLHLLRMLDQMDIGVFAGNHEFSPSQYEINLWHSDALDAADRTFLFKTAVRDIVARTGKHATFLGKPWGDEGGSGFHLHFSVVDNKTGQNLMSDGGAGLSATAEYMIAGLIANAPAVAAFTNPTVNAYKRLGPDTLAPYRANWGHDNRSAMLRVPPERGAGTRLEIRLGDGAANPYLMIAAILAAGLDGITRSLEAPVESTGWAYENEADAVLPMTLSAALDALDSDTVMRATLGTAMVDVFTLMKRDEVERYEADEDPATREVTQWEIDEYLADY